MGNNKGTGKNILPIILVIIIAVVAIWGGSKIFSKKDKADSNKGKSNIKQEETIETTETAESPIEPSTGEYRTEISKEEFEENKKKDEELIELIHELQMQDDMLEYDVFNEESKREGVTEEEEKHMREVLTEQYFKEREKTINKIKEYIK